MNAILFEHSSKGDLWRLEIATHGGRTFANWRKWYRLATGEWQPTRQGATFPTERLPELVAGICGGIGVEPPSGLPDAI